MAGQALPTRRGRSITGINVTPLVDVVLVLLVILMVTATQIASQAIPVDLPDANTGETSTPLLRIGISEEGRLFVDGDEVDRAALLERVRAAKGQGTARALIAADGATRHAVVTDVIDGLRAEGITHYAIVVERVGEKG